MALPGTGAVANDPVTFDRPVGTLSERDREILAFERNWWRSLGPKERAIRQRFGVSAARYHQLLNDLIERPAALEHDPMLVRRLRRLREARRKKRFARHLGLAPEL